jgi:hypothetical protein
MRIDGVRSISSYIAPYDLELFVLSYKSTLMIMDVAWDSVRPKMALDTLPTCQVVWYSSAVILKRTMTEFWN